MRKGQKMKRYLIGGEYLSIRQLAEQPWCRVKAKTIRLRLRKGMNIVEAITTTPWQTRKYYEYKGKKYSAVALSRLPECVVDYGTLYNRLHSYDWPSVELAMTMPVMERAKRTSLQWKRDKLVLRPVQEIIRRSENDDRNKIDMLR